MTDAHFFIPAIKIEKELIDDFRISSSVIDIFKELEIKHESKIAREKEEAKERKRLRQKKYSSREDVKERAKKYREREDVKERAKKYREREDVKEKNRITEKKYRDREDVKEKKRIADKERYAREDIKERAKKYREREDVKEKRRIADKERYAREGKKAKIMRMRNAREDVKETNVIVAKERNASEKKGESKKAPPTSIIPKPGTKPTSTLTRFRCILPAPVPTTPLPVTCLPVIEIPFVERATEPEKRLPPNASMNLIYVANVLILLAMTMLLTLSVTTVFCHSGHRSVTCEDEIDVEFDDGDNSRIPVSQIILLPPDYPVLGK
jgi:hypothetical protein